MESSAISDTVRNSFGQGLAVTDDAIVFTRRPSATLNELVATLVHRDGRAAEDLLLVSMTSGRGSVAASSDGRIVVAELGGLEISEVRPASQGGSELLSRMTGTRPVGPMAWSGVGGSFFHADSTAGLPHWFDLDVDEPPCAIEMATNDLGEPSDLLVFDGQLTILGRSTNTFVDFSATPSCDPRVGMLTPLDLGFTQANALAVGGGQAFVLASGPGLTGFRVVAAGSGGTVAINSHGGAALAAQGGSVYLSPPNGGVIRCPPSLVGCTEVLMPDQIGQVEVLEITGGGLFAVGGSADGIIVSTKVACFNDGSF